MNQEALERVVAGERSKIAKMLGEKSKLQIGDDGGIVNTLVKCVTQAAFMVGVSSYLDGVNSSLSRVAKEEGLDYTPMTLGEINESQSARPSQTPGQ